MSETREAIISDLSMWISQALESAHSAKQFLSEWTPDVEFAKDAIDECLTRIRLAEEEVGNLKKLEEENNAHA